MFCHFLQNSTGNGQYSPKCCPTVVFQEKSAIIQPQPERQDRHCEGLGMTDPHRSEDREVVAMVSVSRSFPGPGLARQSVSPDQGQSVVFCQRSRPLAGANFWN